MSVKQLSIFVENKNGRLADITKVLSEADIDIRAISIADTSDFGILRLIVDKPTEAVEVLRAAHMTVSLTSVIGVGITDQPGEFAKVIQLLSDNKIEVEYMYAFISRDKGKAFIILRVNKEPEAIDLLKANNINILTAGVIQNM